MEAKECAEDSKADCCHHASEIKEACCKDSENSKECCSENCKPHECNETHTHPSDCCADSCSHEESSEAAKSHKIKPTLSKEEEEKALEVFNKRIEGLLSQAVALKEEGNALFKAGELAKARTKYSRVFAFTRSLIAKETDESMVNMASKGLAKGEISNEIKAKAKELERDVNSNMAMVFLKEENYSKAVEKATKSLNIEKTSKGYFRRGKAYAMKNDYENAYKDFEEGKKLGGDDTKIFEEEIEKTKKERKSMIRRQAKHMQASLSKHSFWDGFNILCNNYSTNTLYQKYFVNIKKLY